MTKYFANCRTAEELKREYHKVARRLHPDCNRDRDTTEEFKEMQAEFERAWGRFKNIHTDDTGRQYERETTETAAEYMELINALLKLQGIGVEICGSWVWVTGNTREVKEDLKALGMRFSRNKTAWYYHQGPYRRHGSRKMSLDDIRNKYGSTTFREADEAATA